MTEDPDLAPPDPASAARECLNYVAVNLRASTREWCQLYLEMDPDRIEQGPNGRLECWNVPIDIDTARVLLRGLRSWLLTVVGDAAADHDKFPPPQDPTEGR